MVSPEDIPIIALKTDLADLLQVFAYTNLSRLTSPHPEVLVTPLFKNTLEVYINYLPGGFGLPQDIQEIVNNFILINLNSISRPRATISSNPA